MEQNVSFGWRLVAPIQHMKLTPSSSATDLGNQSCWERALGQPVQPQGGQTPGDISRQEYESCGV